MVKLGQVLAELAWYVHAHTYLRMVSINILQSQGIKGTLHHLPTNENNEPVPKVIEAGCKPVLLN